MTGTKQPEALAKQLAQAFDPDPFIESDRDKSKRLAEQLYQQAKEDAFIRNCSLECEAAKHLLAQESRIADLEAENALINEMNGQLREQNETVGVACAELEAENRALKEQLEAVGAGGVTGLRRAPVLDRDAFERALLKHQPHAAPLECHEGQYASPYVQVAWTGFTFAAAIAQEGGK